MGWARRMIAHGVGVATASGVREKWDFDGPHSAALELPCPTLTRQSFAF
jgi:hypothetical protein